MNAKAYEIIIDWSEEDRCYVSRVPDLPGCMAHGKTRQEAVKMAEEAIELWIETAKEDGVAVPKPKSFAALAGITK
jgi:predicted RNase H-like HicB family nuclease